MGTASAQTDQCLVLYPSRLEEDPTHPAIIEFERASEAECKAILELDRTQDAFSKSHPATRVDAPPLEEPRCTGPFSGYHVKVWGGRYAEFICITVNYYASQAPQPKR